MKERRPDTHYSYTMYADPVMARTFDDRRFGGPIGELVARTQARVLANMVGRIQDRDILDVGTGTGRAALLLAHGGARVTAVDASEEMLTMARRRAADELVAVNFLRGDAHALDFPDRSFDVAVAFRLLMHTPKWRQCVAELCRVSERLVVIDYPSASSVALLESLGRRVAHARARARNRTACSRTRRSSTPSTAAASGCGRFIVSSSCRSRSTRPSAHAGSRCGPRASWIVLDC